MLTIALAALHTGLAVIVLALAGCTGGGGAGTERLEVSPLLSRGDDWSYTFSEEGIYNIRCRPHAQMVQIVRVGTPGSETAVHQSELRNMQFEPRELTIAQGDTVTWTNEDGIQHDVDVRLVVE